MDVEDVAVGEQGWTARMRDFLTEKGVETAPSSRAEVERAELVAGVPLPPVVRELLLEVGPGEIGPRPEQIQRVDDWARVLKFVDDDVDRDAVGRFLQLTSEGVVLWDMSDSCLFWAPSTGAVHLFDGDPDGTVRPVFPSVAAALQERLEENYF